MRQILSIIFVISIMQIGLQNVSWAQTSESAAAEGLFQDGKALLQARDFEKACPKLSESYRLDPATGTLLAVAMCHEGLGRLATAWAEYSEVATRSRREGRDDRERAAREKSDALRAKLSYLTIWVDPVAQKLLGLEVKRDGVVVGQGAWGTALPIDAGDHLIEATAPGKKRFTAHVKLANEGARENVLVPVLADDRTAPGGTGPAQLASAGPTQNPNGQSGSGWTPLQTTGAVIAGVGVIGLGLGGYFGLDAMSKKSDSNASCSSGNICSTQAAFDARKASVSAGNRATVAFIAGGVLAAGGATIFVLGRPSKSEKPMAIKAAPYAVPGSIGMWMGGQF